jgi:hypothetical protein
MGLGHLLALIALDEAARSDRINAERGRRQRPGDEGLDPRWAEARASAWSRWTDRGDAGIAPEGGVQPAPRRAAHV